VHALQTAGGYVTRLVPLVDRTMLLQLLTTHGVTFGAK
jgi:hypothetical protein